MKPGIYFKLAREDYDAAPGVSNTMLQWMRQTPAHCRAYLDGKIEEESKALDFGLILHHAILEPDDFISAHRVAPVSDKRLKEYKEWAKALPLGTVIVTPKERDTVFGMMESVRNHRFGSQIFRDIDTEVSVFSLTDTGFRKKGRPDVIPRRGNVMLDVKTCADASERAFAKSCWTFGYHMQAAYYLDLLTDAGLEDIEIFCIAAIEKEPPYACQFFQFDAAAIEKGRSDYQFYLDRFATCMELGEWPAYPDHPVVLSLPRWTENL